MCDTPFKTPYPYANTPKRSDSDESIASNSDIATPYSDASSDLSIVALFDDLMRLIRLQTNDNLDVTFMEFAEKAKVVWEQWKMTIQECKRLQNLLENRTQDFSDLENKLGIARKLLDMERKKAKLAEAQRDDLSDQLASVRELVKSKDIREYVQNRGSNKRGIDDDIWEKLFSLNSGGDNKTSNKVSEKQLSDIPEINSTGSILSDFSYSRSEDDLDSSKCTQTAKEWKKHRPSTGGVPEPANKKRRSSGNKVVEINTSDTVRATTTLTVTKEGPITATSVIESVPKGEGVPRQTAEYEGFGNVPSNLILESWGRESPRKSQRQTNLRQHSLQQRIVVMPETCGCCEKRIRFGKTIIKCRECRTVCHVECKDKLPLPCVPAANTPTLRSGMGLIGDYTPTTPPMVPGIIVHCLNEIELRGLNEIGLYRIPGSEKEVKLLKEKFFKGRGSPCLNQVDVHVMCGTVKDFLRSLTEPLLTYNLRKEFVKVIQAKDSIDVAPAMCQIIAQLPQPNRDTLAYIMLHLQKVAASPECKMPPSNLAKVLGPTIVGYSSANTDPSLLFGETNEQVEIAEQLLRLPCDFWECFVNVEVKQPQGKLQQTPSTDSLLRPTVTRGLFTPNRNNMLKKNQRFFVTPPSFR